MCLIRKQNGVVIFHDGGDGTHDMLRPLAGVKHTRYKIRMQNSACT